MNAIFTVEQVNLICIFDFSSRSALIAGLTENLAEFDDNELCEIAVSVIDKLNAMTDAEFSALQFYPEYDDYEDVEV